MAVFESQGTVLQRGDGQPTEAFSDVGRVVSISGVGGGASSEIDVTDLSSLGKEFIIGLKDEGSVTITMNLDDTDAQQAGLRADRDSRDLRNFKLILTDDASTTLSFSAYVTTFTISVGVDDKVPLDVQLRISGPIIWT